MSDPLDGHYKLVMKQLTAGYLVPFLGAGANLCGRPEGAVWRRGQYLPSGKELAVFLAENYDYPKTEVKLICPSCNNEVRGTEETLDLLRVSQYVDFQGGAGDLYNELHKLFDDDYPPTSLHQFLANLPAALDKKGYPQPGLLVVTTNYDDLMERAFKAVGQPYDVLTYMAQGDGRGRFLHWPPEGAPKVIDEANRCLGLLEERPVVLKIHGAVNRGNFKQDSYVIREDDYIDYLARTTEISNMLPVTIIEKLKTCHLLFLGYSLSDWNLRVILQRIWSEQAFDFKSWAVQLKPLPIDQKFWSKRNVDILDVKLEDYVKGLETRFQSLPQVPGTPPLAARVP